MYFTKHYTTKWHDTDVNRRVRPSQILMYMQETANLQLQKDGCDLDRLRDEKGWAFLLSRIAIRVYEQLYAYEEIDVQTWVPEGKGVSYPRYLRILRGDTVIAEANSLWALLDLNTRKMVRREDFRFPFPAGDPIQLDTPLRFHMPNTADMVRVGERKIVYSDLDYNGHMNNTHYPDMLCDFTPGMERKQVVSMTFSYAHEAAFGKTLGVYRKDEGEEHLFRTVDENGVTCLEARLVTEKIPDESI